MPKQMEWTVEQGIQATVMAMRELLMDYYKGTCVERLTYSDLSLTEGHRYKTNRTGQNYYYLRRERDIHREMVLSMGDTTLALLSSAPSSLLLFDKVFARSPQLTAVKESVEKFMAEYLSGVEVNHLASGKPDGFENMVMRTKPRDDSDFVKASVLRGINDVPEEEEVRESESISEYVARMTEQIRNMTAMEMAPRERVTHWENGFVTELGTSRMATNIVTTRDATISPNDYAQHYHVFSEPVELSDEMPF